MKDYNAEILKADFIIDGRKTLARHEKRPNWPGTRDPEVIKGVVLHQSLEEHGSASGNAKYHVGPNHINEHGLPGLAYTMFVDRTGKTWLANDVEACPWSQGTDVVAGDENALYLSVCFGGNFSGPGYVGSQELTQEQSSVLIKLWVHLRDVFGFTDNDLYGHYNFGKPACPGHTLMNFIEGIVDPEIMRFNTITSRQEALNRLGWAAGPADGKWTLAWKKALVEFQKFSRLTPDGVWGKKTEIAVRERLGVT